MRRLIIDRFEGKYVICEDAEQKSYAIEITELPENAKVGSVIDITDDGELKVNEEETEDIRNRVNEKQKKLFNKF
ncbi:DUF3006 domain-containing protein [Scatolibacter rhodanostii]|uniref:DUF3006 domain-containing protein n=1 Tax=Scatolibacter rhodanostii TaxID=2014781 RepID=UPI000C074D98|nr:DUF3006 domain-containing protein [Scatolibacter rhodanostii]